MEVDSEPIKAEPFGAALKGEERPDGGLDSDDETLRFEKDDDLYDGEADEEDAKWVAQQVCDRTATFGPSVKRRLPNVLLNC